MRFNRRSSRSLVAWYSLTQGESPACFMAGRNVIAEPTNKPINGATICLAAGIFPFSLFPLAVPQLHSSPLVFLPHRPLPFLPPPFPLNTILCDPEMKSTWGLAASVGNSRGFCATIISESTYNDESLSKRLDIVKLKITSAIFNLDNNYYYLSNIVIIINL